MGQAPAEPPIPLGAVQFRYNPMSPAQWGLVPFNYDVPVYRDVTGALDAMTYWVEHIWARRATSPGRSHAQLPFRILFRGHTEITNRLLPTLLRGPGPWPAAKPRQRYRPDVDPSVAEEVRRHYGDWMESDPELRSADPLVARLSTTWLMECGAQEQAAIARAKTFPEIADLDTFRLRAIVRHYAGTPSWLLDMTTDSKVAAFFATGGGLPPGRRIPQGRYGALCAIDLSRLTDLFTLRVEPIPGGRRIILEQPKEEWGVNAKMFSDQGIPHGGLVFTDMVLSQLRPHAQRGIFISLSQSDGSPLPVLAELHWWSLIERWSYLTGFVHDGSIYEDKANGISRSRLLPDEDPYIAILTRPS